VTGPRRHLPAFLLLLCLGLGAIVYVEAAPSDPPAVPAVVGNHAITDRTREPTFALPPLNIYSEVVARPLFSPTRRPSAAPASAERPANFILTGIIISRRERHVLIAHGVPRRVDRVAEGQDVEGWTVKAIDADRVLLIRGGDEIELKPAAKPGQPTPIGRTGMQAPPNAAVATAPVRPPPRNRSGTP
jgi:hypothetical protein